MKKELTIAENVSLVSDIAMRKSGAAADNALMAIAEKGDEFALEVLRDVPPHVKARIIHDHDFSKPSFIGMLSSPEEVAKAMAADPSTWVTKPELMDNEKLQETMRDIRDFVTGVLLAKDDEDWQINILKAVSESEEAMLYLAIPYVGHVQFNKTEDLYAFDFSYNESCDGEIGHLHRIMKEHAPELEQKLGAILDGGEYRYSSVIDAMTTLYETTNKQTDKALDIAKDMLEDL